MRISELSHDDLMHLRAHVESDIPAPKRGIRMRIADDVAQFLARGGKIVRVECEQLRAVLPDWRGETVEGQYSNQTRRVWQKVPFDRKITNWKLEGSR